MTVMPGPSARGVRLLTIVFVAAISIVATATAVVVFGLLGAVIIAAGLLLAGGRATGSASTLRALGARPLQRVEAPGLVDTVAVLAARAGLPQTPTVAILPDRGRPRLPAPTMNALATGTPDDAVVAVTAGLLRGLTARQIVAVLAHEIAHVRAGDTRVMGVANALAQATQGMSMVGTAMVFLAGPAAFAGSLSPLTLLAILWAPTAATLLLLALSRSREHAADAEAVALTNDPQGLADALLTLERSGTVLEMMLGSRRVLPHPWLRTHPTTASRVARLRDRGVDSDDQRSATARSPRTTPMTTPAAAAARPMTRSGPDRRPPVDVIASAAASRSSGVRASAPIFLANASRSGVSGPSPAPRPGRLASGTGVPPRAPRDGRSCAASSPAIASGFISGV